MPAHSDAAAYDGGVFIFTGSWLFSKSLTKAVVEHWPLHPERLSFVLRTEEV